MGSGSSAGRSRAFSGEISGATINVQSAMSDVEPSGAFTITGAQSGVKTVFAWQDLNANLAVDADDYFGWRTGVVIEPGMTTRGVKVAIQGYPGSLLLVRTAAATRG